MTNVRDAGEHRERLIAGLLRYGTWLAVAIVAAGVLVGLAGGDGLTVAKAGIALFILLPVTRVALMLVLFLRERDHAYAAIAALVLAIIVAGAVAAS